MGLKDEVLGAYRLIAPIGKGGMAEVWLANQLTLNREVAIKIIPDTQDEGDELNLTARFEREARAIAQLDHPGILPVIDYGSAGGYLYLVMPFVRGGSLQERLKRQTLTRGEAFSIFERVLGGVSYAHYKGIIHRDLKPANILLYDDGRAVIADFGVAKTLTENIALTQAGSVVGSPEYMAPEQFMGIADFRSDLYAMGVILYRLLTGRALYSGTTSMEIAMRHLNDPLPIPNPLVPRQLEGFLMKALSKKPEDRFPNAYLMEQAFHQAASQLTPEELRFKPVLIDPLGKTAGGSYVQQEVSPTTPLNLHYVPAPPATRPVNVYQPSTPLTGVGDMRPYIPNAVPNAGNTPFQGVTTFSPAQQKKGRGPGLIIAGVIVLLLVAAAAIAFVVLGNSKSGTPVIAATTTTVAGVTPNSNVPSLTVPLKAMNGTKVTGVGVISDAGKGSVTITLTINGLEPGTHAAHVHAGSCLAQGEVKFPLNSLQAGPDGKASSTTTIQADFATITSGSFYLNVHNQSGTPTYVASCGDITT